MFESFPSVPYTSFLENGKESLDSPGTLKPYQNVSKELIDDPISCLPKNLVKMRHQSQKLDNVEFTKKAIIFHRNETADQELNNELKAQVENKVSVLEEVVRDCKDNCNCTEKLTDEETSLVAEVLKVNRELMEVLKKD